MKVERIISVLAVLAIVFATSCSKIEPLNERGCMMHSDDDAVTNQHEVETTAIMLEENTEGPNITDPDHDEDHDKDDSAESKGS